MNQSVYLLRSPAASTDDLEVTKKNVWHLFYVSEGHVVRVRIYANTAAQSRRVTYEIAVMRV